MPTGINIRDFTKVYREARYSDQGSFRLSEIEHNAYLTRLTVEITHYDAYRSINFKSLPETTHWGYLTAFKGSSVVSNQAVKFTKQRVYEQINQGIWDYHQSTENMLLVRSIVENGANSVVQSGILSDAAGKLIELLLEAKDFVGGTVDNAANWLLGYAYSSSAPSGEIASNYTGFPIVSPFPDAWKFLSDVPVSFLFRLESWYLVNPTVYIASNPTDTSDETEGEDEYPSPDPGDGSGGGENFPPGSAPATGSDPRDYGEEQGEPGTGTWTFVISFSNPGNNAACNSVPPATVALRGFPDEPVQREFTGPAVEAGGRPGRFFTSVDSLNHGGDCQVNGPGSAFFVPDGPTNQ